MSTERARLTALLARCYDDPGLFNTAILARPKLWWRQEEIARSVVHHRDTVVYSGNAIGKDYLVGGVVPWWLYTRPHSLVIVTGPSQTLLGTVTWKEIRRAIEGARIPLGARLSQGAKASPQVVDLGKSGWQALGYSTTNVERASGQHARHLLVIVEEASGVEDEVWDALDSLKYTRLLAIGNPIRAEGRFVQLIRQAERDQRDGIPAHRRVNAIHVPSTDSPDADKETSDYGLADRTWLESCYRRYGKDSLWVRSHIHAVIPTVSQDTLIPEAWLDWCTVAPRLATRPGDPRARKRRIACDLGEGVGRDSSCVLVRDWLGVLEVRSGNAMGLAEAAQCMADMSRKWDVAHEDMSYDKLGIGKGFPAYLAKHGITRAWGYAGSAEPRNSHEFTNLRSEAAWNLRNRLNPEWPADPRQPLVPHPPFAIPAGPYWPRMREELAALTYDLVGKQTRLILKKDLCERLGHSPDVADALIQSFAA